MLPVLQGRLRGKRWIVGSSVHGCWLGTYELGKQLEFQAAVRPGDVVFDVGANVGFYTLLASELVGPGGRVVAFEPLPANLLYLREHLRLNRARNVEVVEAACAQAGGESFFDEGPDRSMGRVDEQGSLRVATVALDEMVEEGRLPAPDVVKMDVEGGEAAALGGARRLLQRHRPTVFLATHGADLHRECCALLAASGYSLRGVGGRALDRTDEIVAVHPGRG